MSLSEQFTSVSVHGDALLTIGVFDGVHRGHQALIGRLREEASRRGLLAVVLTFSNHPRIVLGNGGDMGCITSVRTRKRLLEETGVDQVIMVPFTLELARTPAREFVSLLSDRLRMRGLVVGPNFALGRNREGDVSMLTALGRETGFEVLVLQAQTEDGEVISSSAIRTAIMKGDISKAAALLGRNFTLEGTVVKGDGRGARLGFPTANLRPDAHRVVPGNGIYATWAHVGTGRHPSATSIGVRPTFDGAGRTIETYIMDFEGDLYGGEIALEFVQRLRDEIRFDSVEALKAQMGRDVEQARQVLLSRRHDIA